LSEIATGRVRAQRLSRKRYGFARGCGAAGGVENFCDDEIGFEGGQGVGFGSIEKDGAEIDE
jgi:hypothetical protein